MDEKHWPTVAYQVLLCQDMFPWIFVTYPDWNLVSQQDSVHAHTTISFAEKLQCTGKSAILLPFSRRLNSPDYDTCGARRQKATLWLTQKLAL
jgi:hypothetical protein